MCLGGFQVPWRLPCALEASMCLGGFHVPWRLVCALESSSIELRVLQINLILRFVRGVFEDTVVRHYYTGATLYQRPFVHEHSSCQIRPKVSLVFSKSS